MKLKTISWNVEEIKKSLWQLDDSKKYIVKEISDSRTDRQNRYLHKCFEVIAWDTGYTQEEVKDIMKYKFLSETKKTGKWNEYVTVKSTAQLSKKEFWEFVDNIDRFFRDFWILLPSTVDYGIN